MDSPKTEASHLVDSDSPSTLSPEKVSLRTNTQADDGWTPLLLVAAVSTTVGSAVPFGYNIGVINTPAPVIQQWCNHSLADYHLDNVQLDMVWSVIVSVFLVGGMLGSLAGSWCADSVGRKGALVVSAILGCLSAVMFFYCKSFYSISLILLARFIIGLSSGLTLSVMPMYLLELAPVSVRGAMGVFTSVGVNFGVFFGQFMGLDWILGNQNQWHFLLSLYVVPILALVLTLPVLPESPKYLYSVRGAKQFALQELSRLRGQPLSKIRWELEVEESEGVAEPWTVMSLLTEPSLRLPLALTCALQAGQQCSGINAVFFYSTRIFKSAGLSQEQSQYANMGAGLVNFFCAIVMVSVVNRCRRRTLLHISCLSATATLILLTISITYMDAISWLPKFSIFCVIFYVLVYGIGLGPIPFFIGSELFDVGPRPAAMALGSAANWSGNLLVGLTFPSLQLVIGQYSFLLFASSTAALVAFFHYNLPETLPPSRPLNSRATSLSLRDTAA
ncbi:solute carrier family 2, facilitated glucose transporter member 1-like isoform X2 [Macrosteles quadrilineatus]|nr:solute carrier family 2, facilitated glucose transporter member 1-like isoform X2 [Macrosteles quadrilineatus]